ncbi:MAG: hypothetical protein R2784_09245 [Saprospiraceae bacterium]
METCFPQLTLPAGYFIFIHFAFYHRFGSLVIEVIFNIPGMGKLMVDGIIMQRLANCHLPFFD